MDKIGVMKAYWFIDAFKLKPSPEVRKQEKIWLDNYYEGIVLSPKDIEHIKFLETYELPYVLADESEITDLLV